MPTEDMRRELDNRIRQLTAIIGRTPASVRELLDMTFTGVSSARTVSVTLDFRGVLRGVRISDGTLIPGDERALEAAIMEAQADAAATMAAALTDTPGDTRPVTTTRVRGSNRRPAENENFEDAPNIMQTRY